MEGELKAKETCKKWNMKAHGRLGARAIVSCGGHGEEEDRRRKWLQNTQDLFYHAEDLDCILQGWGAPGVF